jgi:hypothetical protein
MNVDSAKPNRSKTPGEFAENKTRPEIPDFPIAGVPRQRISFLCVREESVAVLYTATDLFLDAADARLELSNFGRVCAIDIAYSGLFRSRMTTFLLQRLRNIDAVAAPSCALFAVSTSVPALELGDVSLHEIAPAPLHYLLRYLAHWKEPLRSGASFVVFLVRIFTHTPLCQL